MSTDSIGTKGFVVWFFILIYMRVVQACKNNFIRMFIHSIGLIITIFGLFFLISIIPSIISIIGMFLVFIGIVIFVTPFGVNAEL